MIMITTILYTIMRRVRNRTYIILYIIQCSVNHAHVYDQVVDA